MITSLRDLIFDDFWLKLFSFALAVLIWFTVNMAVQKDVSPTAPLTLIPTDQRVMSDLPVIVMSSAEDVRSCRVNPKEVEVTVQGDRKILDKLQNKDIRVLVDLTGIQATQVRKRIEVSTPAGVTHVRVVPEDVQVFFPPKD